MHSASAMHSQPRQSSYAAIYRQQTTPKAKAQANQPTSKIAAGQACGPVRQSQRPAARATGPSQSTDSACKCSGESRGSAPFPEAAVNVLGGKGAVWTDAKTPPQNPSVRGQADPSALVLTHPVRSQIVKDSENVRKSAKVTVWGGRTPKFTGSPRLARKSPAQHQANGRTSARCDCTSGHRRRTTHRDVTEMRPGWTVPLVGSVDCHG